MTRESDRAPAEAVAGLLLDRGAAIDCADNRGRTALMTAAELGDAAVVELLLARGATARCATGRARPRSTLTVNEPVRIKLRTR